MQKSDIRLDQVCVRDLRLLATLIETRSVTRTAEILGLSQPAASRALEKLRHILRDRVVVRSAAGGVLTPRGHVIARQIAPILASLDGLFQPETFDPRTARATIHLAATDYGAAVVAGPLAAYLSKEAGGISLNISDFGPRTFDRLALGDLDLALYADAEIPPDFHALDLFHETYACLVRSGHAALTAPVNQEDVLSRLSEAPRAVVLFPDGRRLLPDDVLASVFPPVHVTFATQYFFSVPSAIAASDMVVCLPSRAASILARSYGLRTVPLPAVAGFTYRLIWHERCDQDRQHTWLRERVQRLLC